MPPAQKDHVNTELRRVRDRELELKRITGEISCAECRRLKLKCNKKVPCNSCVRRGCKQICPTGTTAGNATGRQIAVDSAPLSLPNDSDASRKLISMSERIRALEDALQIQSGDDSHPLLAPEYLAIKQGIDVMMRRSDEHADDDDEESLVGAFGTLHVSQGSTRFLGASAADNVLLMEVFDPVADETHAVKAESLSRELAQGSAMWPFAPGYLSRPELIAQLIAQLPSFERVTSLLEAYFSNLAWFMAPIDRTQVFDEIIPVLYPSRRPVSPCLVGDERLHMLSLLYMVFACGSVADLTQPAINPEGEKFVKLARATLGLRCVFDHGSLEAAQTLFLMSSYEIYSARKTSQESSWKFSSVGMVVATSIGLHRDPSRWKLDSKTINTRRRVFWEINAIDKWKALGSGRPPAFPITAIDCEFPLDRGATVEEDGVVVESVWRWRYRFTRDVLHVLAEKLCSARSPKYSDIMEMDCLARDFEVHPFVDRRPKPSYALQTDGECKNLHPYVSLWWKENALLFIHRNCFARALLEYPSDPMRSPFGPSFLATYRCAISLLAILREASFHMALILERVWGLWAISLTCGVIVGSVACRPSTISFAATALRELEKAITVFESGKRHPVAQNGVKLLYRLRDKANAAFERHSCGGRSTGKRDADQLQLLNLSTHADDTGDDEELSILRGTTRLVEQRNVPQSNAIKEAPFSHELLTGNSFSSAITGSHNAAVSPNLSSFSGSPPSEGDMATATPGPAPCETLFTHVVRTVGADALFASSPLVRGSSQSESGCLGTTVSPLDPKDGGCYYDNCVPPFVELQAQSCSNQHDVPEVNGTDSTFARLADSHDPSDSSGSHAQRPTPQTQTYEPQGLFGTSDFFESEPNGPFMAPDVFNMSNFHGPQPFQLFDPSQDPTSAPYTFLTGPTTDPRIMADLNALYQKEDGSTEAWNSFMQQFDLVASSNASHDNWEAMILS